MYSESLGPVRKTHSLTILESADMPIDSQSKTPLGRRLRAIRQRIVDSGERLLSVEELDQELAAWKSEPKANQKRTVR